MEKVLVILRRYAFVLVFLAVVIVGVTGYAYGLRLTKDGLVRAGTLVVEAVPEGTRVFTDQSRLTLSSGSTARVDLLPGSHMVIVDAPGMQPWNELIHVSTGQETSVRPILVPKEVKARVLSGDERTKGADTILSYTLPTKESPLRVAGGCALVYVAGNRIVADATTTPSCIPPSFLSCDTATSTPCPSTVVFPPNERLESVSALPSRDDALVVAAGGQAYVVELDPREPQFFAPILKGVKVRAAPWTDTAIVISDTKKVYELPL